MQTSLKLLLRIFYRNQTPLKIEFYIKNVINRMYLLAKLTKKNSFFVTLMRNWETFSRVIWSSYPDFQKMQQTKFKLSWRWLDGPRRSELYLFLPENNVRKWRHEIYWRESLEIIILHKHFTFQVESVEKIGSILWNSIYELYSYTLNST